ncbi:hypothetical protein N9R79_02970 [Vibrio sp.]|nr:hypothetical protein [Vibrio sp.]
MLEYKNHLTTQYLLHPSTLSLSIDEKNRPNVTTSLLNEYELERLALLSNEQKWIYVTPQCHGITKHTFTHHSITLTKISFIGSSKYAGETDLIKQAILSHNASAIIASSNIPYAQRLELQRLALNNQCTVIFSNCDTPDYIH